MPVYVYRNLVTNETFDYEQRITEDALTVDPRTGDPVRRVIQPVGIAFKGSGFYVNDSRGSTSSSSAQSSQSASAADSASSDSSGASSSSGADSAGEKTSSPATTNGGSAAAKPAEKSGTSTPAAAG